MQFHGLNSKDPNSFAFYSLAACPQLMGKEVICFTSLQYCIAAFRLHIALQNILWCGAKPANYSWSWWDMFLQTNNVCVSQLTSWVACEWWVIWDWWAERTFCHNEIVIINVFQKGEFSGQFDLCSVLLFFLNGLFLMASVFKADRFIKII